MNLGEIWIIILFALVATLQWSVNFKITVTDVAKSCLGNGIFSAFWRKIWNLTHNSWDFAEREWYHGEKGQLEGFL